MSKPPDGTPEKKRLVWIDIAKGLGIWWVVYFHFVTNYLQTETYSKLPGPTSGRFIAGVAGEQGFETIGAGFWSVLKIIWLAVSNVGFHAVGLFIVLGGWALAATTSKKADKQRVQWGEWYSARFIRLYPMYWCAHLVLLALPFTWLEPIDYRFLVSLTGLRWVNIQDVFYYGNAAWWYFAMLVEFYAIFPVLFLVMRRVGLMGFLGMACVVGFGIRYLLLIEWQSNGMWVLGGNCLSRLPEFALGMVLGVVHARNREQVEGWLLGWKPVVLGLLMYWYSSLVHSGNIPYVFADFYTGIACSLVVIGVSGWIERWSWGSRWASKVGAYSFGLYLTHQPFVVWLGRKIQDIPVWQFLGVSVLVLVGLTAFGILLETRVNGLTDWFLSKRKASS